MELLLEELKVSVITNLLLIFVCLFCLYNSVDMCYNWFRYTWSFLTVILVFYKVIVMCSNLVRGSGALES